MFWLCAGFTFAVIDAWLSMQAMFGILNPQNPIQWLVAVVIGLLFTLFAVLSEPLELRESWAGLLFWLAILAIDVATSVLCAIWYGLLGHSFSQRIDLSQIVFDVGNWHATSVYVVFVIITAAMCIQFGRAIKRLNGLRGWQAPW